MALLLEDSRVSALLMRMGSPQIELAATDHDEATASAVAPASGALREITGTAHAVIWESSLTPAAAKDYARRRLGLDATVVAEAGGNRELDADRAALERIAAGEARTFIVFTPAWEPPLLELLDFLAELRRRVGTAAIVVMPVPDGEREVSEVERDTWRRAVGRLGDPHLFVET
jgi:hypothetical protein